MRSHPKAFSISAFIVLLVASVACVTSVAVMAASPSTLLTGAQEVPAVPSDASAISTISVAADMTMSGNVDTMGIESTMAHIQLGAVGINGPIVVTLAQVSATRWSVPAGTKLSEAQYQSYKAGNLYVNVHSVAYNSGEIRLQLSP
jgi:CHRD domain